MVLVEFIKIKILKKKLCTFIPGDSTSVQKEFEAYATRASKYFELFTCLQSSSRLNNCVDMYILTSYKIHFENVNSDTSQLH